MRLSTRRRAVVSRRRRRGIRLPFTSIGHNVRLPHVERFCSLSWLMIPRLGLTAMLQLMNKTLSVNVCTSSLSGLCHGSASNIDDVLHDAKWEIARSIAWDKGAEPPPRHERNAVSEYLQANAPVICDPFSGGASISLEAQRLGLRSRGSDLNPVAVLIGKALVEIPPKFARQPPVNPAAQAELRHGGHWNGRGAEGLAEDVRHYARWIRAEANRRLEDLYPRVTLDNGSQATVIAWMWTRTVRSPDPSANGAHVPLVSSFLLSTHGQRKAWIEVVIDPDSRDGYRFDVHTGYLSDQDAKRLKSGTKTGRGANFRCVLSGAAITDAYVRSEGMAGRLGQRLMAIIADAKPRRIYLSPTSDHEDAAACEASDDVEGIAIEMSANPRWFSPPFFGLRRYSDLFTNRQLRGLLTLSKSRGQCSPPDHARCGYKSNSE